MFELLICYLILCNASSVFPVSDQDYDEKYRLQFHYSVQNGWSNDPNGLIFSNGIYHLYYQYYPNDKIFGPMHWGHAQSTDLIHWETQPIAIYPYDDGVIYSGCCILDTANITGITPKTSTEVPIIAIYTIHSENNTESQGMAYSFDNGLTFTQYIGNPIIRNRGSPDFRDPNIFFRNGTFYMILAVNDRLQFFSSQTIIDWKYESDFGISPNQGDKNGVWECPSLVQLKDEQGNQHDVLILSLNYDQLYTGQMQYFIGEFNGSTFNSYDTTRVLRVDSGFDNYAGIPYHNDPLGRVIVIGWMSNWIYAHEIPTSNWRGQMTIPRELALQSIDGLLYLIQRPIDALNTLIDTTRMWSLTTPVEISGIQTIDLTSQIPFKIHSMLTLEYSIDIQNAANGTVELQFGNEIGEFVRFFYMVNETIYGLDRRNSGEISFNSKFAERIGHAKRINKSQLLTGRIVLDTASIEIFADNGLNTFSGLFFSTQPYDKIQFTVALDDTDLTKSIVVQNISIAALKSIWMK